MSDLTTGGTTTEGTNMNITTTQPTVLAQRVVKRRGPKPKHERNAAFASLYNSGATKEELCRVFGLKPNTVSQYIVRLRQHGLITRRSAPDRSALAERNQRIVERHRAGASRTELADEFGLSVGQVRNVLTTAEAHEHADPVLYPALHLSTIREIVAGGEEAVQHNAAALVEALSSSLRLYETLNGGQSKAA